MVHEAKSSMILCLELEPDEQKKVERLDAPIWQKFATAGCVVRLCQARIDDGRRVIDFCGPTATEGGVDALEFVAASDVDAVAMIALRSRQPGD